MATELVGLSSRQVCQAAGITYRQLDYWVRAGLLVPVVPATGSGSARRFDVGAVAVARRLAVASRQRRLRLADAV